MPYQPARCLVLMLLRERSRVAPVTESSMIGSFLKTPTDVPLTALEERLFNNLVKRSMFHSKDHILRVKTGGQVSKGINAYKITNELTPIQPHLLGHPQTQPVARLYVEVVSWGTPGRASVEASPWHSSLMKFTV